MAAKKNRKELLASAPWRGEDNAADKFPDGKLSATTQPGSGSSTMHVPRKNSASSNRSPADRGDSGFLSEIDPELRYTFRRNLRFVRSVFTIDTIVKPLPPAMAYNLSRNLGFFTRIFTQFFDPDGIADAQKSLFIGQEEKHRRVR